MRRHGDNRNVRRNTADTFGRFDAVLNYLCKGYHQFFKHVAPYMDFMKNELMNQRPPANVMDAIKENKLIID